MAGIGIVVRGARKKMVKKYVIEEHGFEGWMILAYSSNLDAIKERVKQLRNDGRNCQWREIEVIV